MKRRFFLFLFAFLTLTCTTQAAAYQPGFKTVGIWEPVAGTRFDLAVWYPSNSSAFQVDYGDWNFSVARGRPPVEGMHPLILLSHDSAGSRFSLHQLAGELARNGFVAVAMTHPGDNVDDIRSQFLPDQATLRAVQLSRALDVVLSDPETAPLIDAERIGVFGIGPGGTAAMLLGGARLDASGWAGYCNDKLDTDDPYCTPWAKSRLDATCAAPQKPTSQRDRRVRVVAAIAPSYPMLFTRPSLSRIRIPILLGRAENDRMYTLQHAERLLGSLPQPPQLVMLPGADAATLMSPCGSTLAQTLPEMCRESDVTRRDAVQDRMASETVAFFIRHLGTPNPPPLPPEPEESIAPAPAPVQDKQPPKRRKK